MSTSFGSHEIIERLLIEQGIQKDPKLIAKLNDFTQRYTLQLLKDAKERSHQKKKRDKIILQDVIQVIKDYKQKAKSVTIDKGLIELKNQDQQMVIKKNLFGGILLSQNKANWNLSMNLSLKVQVEQDILQLKNQQDMEGNNLSQIEHQDDGGDFFKEDEEDYDKVPSIQPQQQIQQNQPVENKTNTENYITITSKKELVGKKRKFQFELGGLGVELLEKKPKHINVIQEQKQHQIIHQPISKPTPTPSIVQNPVQNININQNKNKHDDDMDDDDFFG